MKRILFIPGQGFAHVTRSLRLADVCKESFNVEILISTTFEHLAKSIKIPYKIIDTPTIDYQSIIKGNYGYINKEEYTLKDAEIYEKKILDYHPDLVITSAAMNSLLPIRKHLIKHIALTDSFTVNELRSGNNFNNPNIESIKESLLAPFNKASVIYGLKPINDLLDLMSHDLNFMPDLSCLFPLSEPSSIFKFIGPLSWRENSIPIDPRIKIDRKFPLLYVSMGSSGDTQYLENVAKYISNSSFQAILTTGNVIDEEKLKSLKRPGFYIEQFVSGNQVMKMSEKTIVVCHAGLGTIYQALENGAHGIVTIPAHFKHITISRILKSLNVVKEINTNAAESLISTCNELIHSPQSEIFHKIEDELEFFRNNKIALSLITEYLTSN